MNCKKAKQWISLEMDGELAPTRIAALEEHLGACETCRVTREAWTGFSNVLGGLADAPVYTAEAAWADVRRGLRNRKPESAALPVWGLKPAWIGAAAALLLAVGLLFGLNSFNRTPEFAYNAANEIEVEIGIPNSGFMVWEDEDMTLIWIDDEVPEEVERAGS